MLEFAIINWMLCVLLGAAACVLMAMKPGDRRPRSRLRWITAWLWASQLPPLIVARTDWQPLFWVAQATMMSLFLISGPLLLDSCQGQQAPLGERRTGAPWRFLAMLATYAIAPLLLIQIAGEVEGRNLGAPIRRLFELLQWNFGAALPECLELLTPEEVARGVGHLPREVSVPLGLLLIACWLWLVFCALLLIAKNLPGPGLRRGFCLFAPLLLGSLSLWQAQSVVKDNGWFDPRFFWPGLADNSGLWTSDPALLRSFGPLLLAALGAAILVAIHQVLERRAARRARDAAPVSG